MSHINERSDDAFLCLACSQYYSSFLKCLNPRCLADNAPTLISEVYPQNIF